MFQITILVLCILLTVLFLVIVHCSSYPSSMETDRVTYTFWTGGFDSTFRICELVIVKKKMVQPVYVSAIIDNTEDKTTRRRSHQQELETMERIRDMLPENVKKRLLPLLNINEVKLDEDIKVCMNSLYKKKKMRRPTCQYGALAQVTRNLRKPVEVAVEYAPGKSMMYHCVEDSLDCGEVRQRSGVVAKIVLRKDTDLRIFLGFVFPTISYSKEDMFAVAVKNRFDHILRSTWSCWYPSEDGSPCKKCIMCLERII